MFFVIIRPELYKFGVSNIFMKQAYTKLLYILMLLLPFIVACSRDSVNENEKLNKTAVKKHDLLTNLGNAQWQMGNYQEALKYFTKAYTNVKATGDQKQMASLLNNLGLVHWRLGNNTAAMECYDEAAQLAEKLNMPRLLGLTHTNRSLILKEQRNFPGAFINNNQAIAIFKKLKAPRDLAIAYNNQGQIYRFNEQPEEALLYYNLSLKECRKINYAEGMATAYQNLSTIYTTQANPEKAYFNARKSLAVSSTLKSKVRISEAYLELSQIHSKFARPDSALYYFKKHYEREKELMDAAQSDMLSRYQANLGIEVKNLRIQNLQNERQIANNRLWFIISGILITMLTASFFVYRYLSRMRFKKRQLELELITSRQLVEVKEQELKTYIVDLSKKNNIINVLKGDNQVGIKDNEDDEVADLLGQKILTDDDWGRFKIRFGGIYPHFFTCLKESSINVTEAEIRILVLMRLNLKSKDMANILGISPQSVRVCKMRLKKKLSAQDYNSVEDFLQDIIS